MKNLLLSLSILFVLAGCGEDADVVETIADDVVPVRVSVNDISTSVTDLSTRAQQSVADCENVKTLTLAFYNSNGVEVYSHTQKRSEKSTYSTFGEFQTSLPIDRYTMIVIGSGSDSVVTLYGAERAAYTSDKCRDTFVCSKSVEVEKWKPLAVNAALTRAVAYLNVHSTDIMPTAVKKVRVRIDGGSWAFNPSTLLSADNNGVVNEITPVGGFNNTSGAGFFTYLFLNSEEQTVDVFFEVFGDNDVLLNSRQIKDVQLKRNCQTTLYGTMFTNASASSFTVDTDWDDAFSQNF